MSDISPFQVVGEGVYDQRTDKLDMRPTWMGTPDQVVQLINRVTYKKWEISARPRYYANGVSVHVEFQADNSSPRAVDPRPKVWADDTWDVPGGLSYEDTLRAIYNGLARTETHEQREFFRVDGQAPFHPHRFDGQRSWHTTSKVPQPADDG